MTRLRLLSAGLAFALPLVLVGACVSESDRAPTTFDCPPAADWPVVSAVLEHDCGTIECHGAPSRPLRIYGRNGTRASKDSAVGVEATTDEELAHNRDSVCGLEPELMTAVAAGDAEIEALTVVRKPRLFEAHKGGRVWVDDSHGLACFASWLGGTVDVGECETQLQLP